MIDINYELYKVFYHVASTLNFSEASKQLFISQSAVSQSIKTLERKLDQTLFIRSTKKVQLTPEGEILMRHIEPAMNLIQKGEAQLLEAASTGGQIRIGASDTICRYFLIPYLERFHKAFPNAHIKVINQTSVKCTELLKNGLVDLIVVNYPNNYLGSVSSIIHIKKFKDVFIAGDTYPELKGEKLSFRQIIKYPILMLDKNSTTNEFLHRLFQQHQLDLVPEIELTSNDLLIDLARIGLGIAFIPDYCISDKTEGIHVLETKEELPERELVIAYNEHLPRSNDFFSGKNDTPAVIIMTLRRSFFPELLHRLLYFVNTADPADFPFSWKQVLILLLAETVIQEENNASILFCPDHRQTGAPCSCRDRDTHSQTLASPLNQNIFSRSPARCIPAGVLCQPPQPRSDGRQRDRSLRKKSRP